MQWKWREGLGFSLGKKTEMGPDAGIVPRQTTNVVFVALLVVVLAAVVAVAVAAGPTNRMRSCQG